MIFHITILKFIFTCGKSVYVCTILHPYLILYGSPNKYKGMVSCHIIRPKDRFLAKTHVESPVFLPSHTSKVMFPCHNTRWKSCYIIIIIIIFLPYVEWHVFLPHVESHVFLPYVTSKVMFSCHHTRRKSCLRVIRRIACFLVLIRLSRVSLQEYYFVWLAFVRIILSPRFVGSIAFQSANHREWHPESRMTSWIVNGHLEWHPLWLPSSCILTERSSLMT